MPIMTPATNQKGFTLIELLVAMTVFSMMLVIVVTGFITIIRLHNQAIAINIVQDNARSSMDAIIQTIRDSTGGSTTGAPPTGERLCLNYAVGQQQLVYVAGGVMFRADGCTTPSNVRALTGTNVVVSNFDVTINSGPGILKPQIEVSMTMASNNGTTLGSGSTVRCGTAVQQRTFCSVVTLNSGATPR
jgi:prepilin-type N-terminal cleavage/methylation domain-containing protein